jgi:lipopolysaccharide export system protein LptA
MRPNGRELESIETPAAGSIEFVPNRSGQPHRSVTGDRILIAYGAKNLIQSFRTVNAATQTVRPRLKDTKQAPPPQLTWSKDLLATFQANTSQLAKIEQWNDFRYEEGDRRAKADRAMFDQPANLIDLTGMARVWDSSGSSDADHIHLNQQTGEIQADGNVRSTRLSDSRKDQRGGMLSADEPLHARAKSMKSVNGGALLRYEGNAVLWQSANRLEADMVEIDRDNKRLEAEGHVVSQFLDKNGGPTSVSATTDARRTPARAFTTVRAPELEYDDVKRLAHYKNGVVLERPNMQVKAREIRAFLRTEAQDSSVDRAFADGTVQIVQTAPGRTRNGSSEHAEYYVDDEKVILEKGEPRFEDSLRGTTRGEKLTWFSKDDRLLVNGVEDKPAKSVIRRRAR